MDSKSEDGRRDEAPETRSVSVSAFSSTGWTTPTNLISRRESKKAEIVAALSERLKEKLSVENDPERGNRDKAITILTKVWVTVPKGPRNAT